MESSPESALLQSKHMPRLHSLARHYLVLVCDLWNWDLSQHVTVQKLVPKLRLAWIKQLSSIIRLRSIEDIEDRQE